MNGDDALDAVFDEFGVAATYIAPHGADETPVILLPVQPDSPPQQFGRTAFAATHAQAVAVAAVEVRRAELPRPATGAQMRIDGVLYDVGRPEPMGARAQKWRLPLCLVTEE